MSLFGDLEESNFPAPLADRMRPKTFEEFVGQESLVGPDRPLRRMIESGRLVSVIFWGPPGSGKTTLARLIASTTKAEFREISAVNAGVKDLRAAVQAARDVFHSLHRQTILFIDEIHRFNKAQQDAVLPFVERGEVILIGSTTENPSFEVIPALRSRCRILRLDALSEDNLLAILKRAVADGFEEPLVLDEDGITYLVSHCGGDARVALNALEGAVFAESPDKDGVRHVKTETLASVMQRAVSLYDKKGDTHFDIISALQKSLRGSDPDAAIYWLARMVDGGEDVRFVARRILVTAAEDVGNADPEALVVAAAAAQAADFLGWPEARIPLAQACIYIARAPKSNEAIMAIDKAINDIQQGAVHNVPMHLRDAHYRDAKKYGHGTGYKYPHDYRDAKVKQQYLPDELKDRRYCDREEPKQRKPKDKP